MSIAATGDLPIDIDEVPLCSGLASRWHDCRCGLEGQEISDADHPQYLAFKRAYAVPEPDREVARRFRVSRMSANRGGGRWPPAVGRTGLKTAWSSWWVLIVVNLPTR